MRPKKHCSSKARKRPRIFEWLPKFKKASKTSKSQKENEGIKARLVEELVAIGKAVTVTEFIKASKYAQENEFSNQKITSLFSQLEKAKEIQKVVLKGKSYYSA